MLYLLLLIFIILLIINYFGSESDIFNPGVVFSLMNIISIVVCIVAVDLYNYDFHFNTVVVLSTGGIVFTIVNVVVSSINKGKMIRASGIEGSKLNYIVIRRYWIILFILFEIVVAYYMIRYVNNVVHAYYGRTYDFATNIGKYNNIVKLHGEEYRKLPVRSERIYSFGWPLSMLLCVFLGAVASNNYILRRKLDKLLIIPIFLPIIMSLFTGSRSNAFRFITAFIAEYIIILRYHKGNCWRGSRKIIRRLLIIVVAVIIAMFLVVDLIGRAISMNSYQYFVAYIGGPIINLDSYLQHQYHSSFFGQETFQTFYSYIGGRFDIPFLRYDLNLPYFVWQGIDIGNVRTMYYMFIEDFGYWGIVPLTAIIAFFYSVMYKNLMNLNSSKNIFRPRLLIYAYLFNDLIMLTFSNRFYETVLSTFSIRVYLWLVLIFFFYRHRLFCIRVKFRS